MFNLSGSEVVFLLVMGLIILGPEKLPDMLRKFGKTYGDLKRMSTGFQSELREAFDEPMQEMRATADALKRSIDLEANASSSPMAEQPTPAPEPGQRQAVEE